MKYDDASWHYNETFPEGSPQEYSGTHIALFLKWCFIKGLAGEVHLEDNPEGVNAVINGTLSATDFFFDNCDGKLTDEDFNDQGNEFANFYYGENGKYLVDYPDYFGELMFVGSEQHHDFEKFSAMMQKRWKEWEAKKSKKKEQWIQKLFGR